MVYRMYSIYHALGSEIHHDTGNYVHDVRDVLIPLNNFKIFSKLYIQVTGMKVILEDS
jgi:hypothetical protein